MITRKQISSHPDFSDIPIFLLVDYSCILKIKTKFHFTVKYKCLRLLLALHGCYLSAALQVRALHCIAVNTPGCLQSYEANETHCRANDTCPI